MSKKKKCFSYIISSGSLAGEEGYFNKQYEYSASCIS